MSLVSALQLRACWKLVGAEISIVKSSPMALMSSLVTQFFFGVLFLQISVALHNTGSQSLSEEALRHYVWVSQIVYGFAFISADPDLTRKILDGSWAYDLLKPGETSVLSVARIFGRKWGQFILRVVPFLLLLLITTQWTRIPNLLQFASFVSSLFLAAMLSASICLLATVTCVWTREPRSVATIFYAFASVLSGVGIPLPIFPDWYRELAGFLPFVHLAHTPAILLLTEVSAVDIFSRLFSQALWIIAIFSFAHILLARSLKNAVQAGG